MLDEVYKLILVISIPFLTIKITYITYNNLTVTGKYLQHLSLRYIEKEKAKSW